MCLVRSEGFLKLMGHMLHWLANFVFVRAVSSPAFNSEIRSFSARLLSKTFSDKIFDDSTLFRSTADTEGSIFEVEGINNDLPFSARFLENKITRGIKIKLQDIKIPEASMLTLQT